MRKSKVAFIAAGCAGLVLSLAVYAHSKFVLPVLMYHSVTARSSNALEVSAGTFERQMRLLREKRYRVVSFEEAAGMIAAREKPGRTVAVTFDDGYENNYTYAFPILSKYRIPATVFLIYSKVGTPGYLSWDEIMEMQASGLVTFGSHTLSHRPLTEMDDAGRVREIVESKKLLEEKLGRSVQSFSYPVGNYDATTRREVSEAGYTAAAATNPGKKAPDDDRFLIKRLRISENCANDLVFLFETSGYYNLLRESRHKQRTK